MTHIVVEARHNDTNIAYVWPAGSVDRPYGDHDLTKTGIHRIEPYGEVSDAFATISNDHPTAFSAMLTIAFNMKARGLA